MATAQLMLPSPVLLAAPVAGAAARSTTARSIAAARRPARGRQVATALMSEYHTSDRPALPPSSLRLLLLVLLLVLGFISILTLMDPCAPRSS